jgi:hypothetical protein
VLAGAGPGWHDLGVTRWERRRSRHPGRPAGTGGPATSFGADELTEALYRGLLGRFPDPAGLEHHVRLLESGAQVWEIVRGIRDSSEASGRLLRSPELAQLGPNAWAGSRRPRGEPLVYFCHLMKTGGTALVDAAVANAAGRMCVTGLFLDHLVMVPSVVWRHAALVSGHLGLEGRILLPPDVVTVTVVRDPLERTLSHYSHVLRDPALAAEAGGLALEEFISDPRWAPYASNYQARSLVQRVDLPGAWSDYSPLARLEQLAVPTPARVTLPLQSLYEGAPLSVPAEDLESSALAALDTVELVGVSDGLDELWHRLAAVWGIDSAGAVASANVSPARIEPGRVPASVRRGIEEANRADQALYERARAKAGAGRARRQDGGPRPERTEAPGPAVAPHTPGHRLRRRYLGRPSGVPAFTLGAMAALTVGDLVSGAQTDFIPALVVGPCVVAVTGRWRLTVAFGVLAALVTVVLGIQNGIWGTAGHYELLGTAVGLTLGAAAAAGLLGRSRRAAALAALAATAA